MRKLCHYFQEVLEVIKAHIVRNGEALRLMAKQDTTDHEGMLVIK